MTLTIIGLGYVGLPLAQAAAKSGVKVYGFDINENVVNQLNAGISHIDDLSDGDISELIKNGFQATTDPTFIKSSDYIVICVPTPLNVEGHPDLRAIIASAETIAKNLTKGSTVILESTTYPGTTSDVLIPILETSGLKACIDFEVAFSPERVDPGNPKYGISNTPKIVGGNCSKCTESAMNLYSQFVETVIPAKGLKEAETAKLLENTYRHVNIALVNELAQLCNELDIDVWDVIRCASTKPFGFQAFWPSAGVGGHCIPIDPNYLAFKVREDLGKPFKFIELAELINSEMPTYLVSRFENILSLSSANILLLGIAYKANIADSRETPARPLITHLKAAGAKVSVHDPVISQEALELFDCEIENDLSNLSKKFDLVVILQPHNQFISNNGLLRKSGATIFDSTGKFAEIADFTL